MKKSYCLIFILLVGISPGVKAQQASKPDTLRDAFLARPLSIIKEEPRWNMASTDLYTAWLSNGLYGLYGAQPQIMLNGIPINSNLFGWQNLNMLPIFAKNINKAASHFAPGIYEQTVAGSGVINFMTEPLNKGVNAKIFYYSGNETKDPGPWAYDSLKMSPNIDRWGPDKGVMLAYKAPKWFIKGFYLQRFHKPRDLAQNLRLHITNSLLGTNSGYVNHLLYIDSKSGLVKAGFNSTHWKFSSRFILSENKDYLFLQPFGREIPTRIKYHQFALQGSYNYGSWHVNSRYISDYKTLHKREKLHVYIFDWQQLNHTLSLSGSYKSRLLHITPGVIFKQLNIEAPGLEGVSDNLFTLFFKSAILFDQSKFYMNSYLDLNQGASSKSITMTFGAALKFSDNYTANPEISYSDLNPIRQHAFAYWVNRGYTLNTRLNIPFNQNVSVVENRTLSLRLNNKLSAGQFSFQIAPQLVINYRLNIPWQVVTWREITNTMPGTFTVSQNQGNRFKLLLTAKQRVSSIFQQSLAIYIQKTVTGTSKYRQYFEMIPDTKVKYQADYSPFKGLQLSLNATYRSAVKWNEFAAVDGKQYHLPSGIPIVEFKRTFHSKIPGFLNLGFSVQKDLFDNHLSAQAGFQNILDQEVRYHAIGASLFPKVNFKVTFRF